MHPQEAVGDLWTNELKVGGMDLLVLLKRKKTGYTGKSKQKACQFDEETDPR